MIFSRGELTINSPGEELVGSSFYLCPSHFLLYARLCLKTVRNILCLLFLIVSEIPAGMLKYDFNDSNITISLGCSIIIRLLPCQMLIE